MINLETLQKDLAQVQKQQAEVCAQLNALTGRESTIRGYIQQLTTPPAEAPKVVETQALPASP